MTPYKVGYLVGSLAKASINRLLASALVRLAPAELEMSEISFKDLPPLQLRLRRQLPASGHGVQGCDRSG